VFELVVRQQFGLMVIKRMVIKRKKLELIKHIGLVIQPFRPIIMVNQLKQ
jgi:hypothetical protein